MYQDRRNPHLPGDMLSGRLLYFNTLCNLFASMVTVEGPDVEGTPPQFIINAGLMHGAVAFIEKGKPAAGWYGSDGAGERTRFDFYKRLYLTQANDERGFYRTDKTAKEIRFSASRIPLTAYFLNWATTLDAFDRAIRANVNAARFGRFIGVPREQRNTVKLALAEGANGDPVIVGNDIVSAFQNSDISVNFITPSIIAAKNAFWAGCIKQIGGVTAQQQADERVQTAQVNAAIGESVDFIYSTIAQFNGDAEYHGVRARMIYTGFAARYDAMQTPTPKDVAGVQTAGSTAEKEDETNGTNS